MLVLVSMPPKVVARVNIVTLLSLDVSFVGETVWADPRRTARIKRHSVRTARGTPVKNMSG